LDGFMFSGGGHGYSSCRLPLDRSLRWEIGPL
jgi:hypothetical protein